jgi:iron(III) transport system permease protein
VVLGFNALLTDYNVAAFLSHPLKEPLGLMIKRYTTERASGDAQAIIFVYSTILMIIASSRMYLVYGKLLNKKLKK